MMDFTLNRKTGNREQHRVLRFMMTTILTFLVGLNSHAQTTFTSGDLKYTITSTVAPLTVTVSGPVAGTSYTGPLTIPETVDYNGSAYTITSIGNNAFHNCTQLVTENLILPSGLTSIGAYAFNNCPGLKGSLTIPSGVTSIGDHAFNVCTGLTGLTISSGVTSIGTYAFNQCTGLKGSLTIPGSVTSIGERAFYGCTGLTGLTISSGVASIGTYAFNQCTGLKGSLTIPGSVTSIGEHAFYGCTGFTGTLTISDGVRTIGDRAFQNATFTGDLTIPNSVTSLGAIAAFCGCSKFNGNLTLSNQLTTIGTATFQGCSGLTGTLTIPNGVTTISDDAFNSCKSFTGNLTIPSSVTAIGNNAFNACSGFNGTLTIPDGVQTIGGSAFLNCTSMIKATIPHSITSIGGAAFCGCGKMLVSFNEGYTGSIGGAALQSVKGVWFTDKTPAFNPSATAGVDIGIYTTYYLPEDDVASNAQTDATSIKALYKAKISSTNNVIYRYYHVGLKTASKTLSSGNTTGVATLYVNFPAIVPAGLTAYYGKEVPSSGVVRIKSIDNTLSTTTPSINNQVTTTIIPTKCGVVLMGDVMNNITVFEAATTSGAIEPTGTAAEKGILSGSLTDIEKTTVYRRNSLYLRHRKNKRRSRFLSIQRYDAGRP
jgi:hypothetical protein